MASIATLKGLKCPHCGSENITVKGTKGSTGTAVATSLAFGAIGAIVAGKNAAKNVETAPLEYKCNACGQKFETLPLEAPENEILETPCTVTFTREKSMVGAAVPQILYINGVKLGAVKNGESITFQVSNRYNNMFVTDQYGVAFGSEFRFEAAAGGSVNALFNRKFTNTSVLAAVGAQQPAIEKAPEAGPTAPDEAPMAAQHAFEPAPRPRKKMKKWLKITIISVCAVIVLVFGAAIVSRAVADMRTDRIHKFYECMYEYDFDGARAYAKKLQKGKNTYYFDEIDRLARFRELYDAGSYAEAIAEFDNGKFITDGMPIAEYCNCYYQLDVLAAEEALEQGRTAEAIELLLQFNNRFYWNDHYDSDTHTHIGNFSNYRDRFEANAQHFIEPYRQRCKRGVFIGRR